MNQNKCNPKYLLALNSSYEKFGLAVLDLTSETCSIENATFKNDRTLSNNLFSYIETLLPSQYWSDITRISVAIGPGGFTATRLTIAMARILAQQLNCPLDGISNFAIMAPRLSKQLKPNEIKNSFWIQKKLKRNGFIAGEYKVNYTGNNEIFSDIIELQKPFILDAEIEYQPTINAEENINEDTRTLLQISLKYHQAKKISSWVDVLPIYITSPV